MIPLSFALKITEIEGRIVWLSWIIPLVLATIGIWRSRVEKIKIFFFTKIDRYFALALFGGAVVSALLFLTRVWFKNMEIMSFVGAKDAFLYFFTYYVLFIPLIFISFLGGEICWRGYLWQKWKNYPLKGGIIIWLLWCLSSIPLVTNIPQDIPYMAFYNLMLMPILHFFRYKSGAIGPGTLFYASYFSAFMYLRMIFSAPAP
ncbi:CPBP family glutamic-type intramembrane protease [Candidatus Rhabdochlamydia sp. T3358]|uniref:CPBP family glutamic-type intramembrane protease n=1 Tax=Candidatus Rhabdochlamydia sp. T3358 TaxID=2099795 RepID=UPI0010B749A7|nr:CPBP family glutamic-type intramembrane protease [Candidatus Rhabdochlamydia sp. T3358]VHO03995.1 hypothetical protein RHT_01159 [Candidatus Rhabdochlamydia sp. T3358]